LKKFGKNELEEKSDPKWLVVSAQVLVVVVVVCCHYML